MSDRCGQCMNHEDTIARLRAELEKAQSTEVTAIKIGTDLDKENHSLRAEVERLHQANLEGQRAYERLVGIIQRRQPAGSPPPGDAEILVRWIFNEASRQRDEALAQVAVLIKSLQGYADDFLTGTDAQRVLSNLPIKARALLTRLERAERVAECLYPAALAFCHSIEGQLKHGRASTKAIALEDAVRKVAAWQETRDGR